eukprot:TRINITY_DN34217_c0_g1_i1.p1 TRINITY_DN34217_c0_g1~~TRINITY_DN34217_c0_g1_i1.p1  ORF type:complete len:525 (+),score=125.00 TRINITY_DN34217_c0_g1_i1:185-1759(+)
MMMYSSAVAFDQEYGCAYGAGTAGNGYYVHPNGYANSNGYHAQIGYDDATGSSQYGYAGAGEAAAGLPQCGQSKTPCSFFMRGKCTKGAACSFSHEGPGHQQYQEQQGQSMSLAMQLLDAYSDWSDSDEEEEVCEKSMENKKLVDLVLPSTRSIQEADMEPAGEPSPYGMSASKASSEDCSEGDVISSTASEPEAEEPASSTPCNDSWGSSVPVSPSKRFAIVDPVTKKLVEAPPPLKLEVSENSWAAQQRRKSTCSFDETPSDEQVARSIKSILNKLTIEKFDVLSKQLIGCGLRTADHAELLIHELFEKATTQHHFIDMYADLCVLLHKHFTDHPFAADALESASKCSKAISFKRLLLDECQSSFERRVLLSKEVDCEDEGAALRYKTHMLGNIKLVGALLSRSMLAGKVGIAILEELLGSPTPESLECVAVLLTSAGSAIDKPEWNYYAALNHFFGRIEQVINNKQCKARERFLLRDLLELRANGWVDKRPKKLERATRLKEVAEQANEERPFLTLHSLRP